jgi:tRNA threonylcarbamoyladenosine biosynthesis protein TsaE
MATFISHSPAETESLGERWGRAAQPGLVIGLSGDLGAGKTQLVKGLARGLGITARVHSPTFTLVNEYGGGRLRLFHLDLYRLETRGQMVSAGLEEFLQPDGVTVIEWAERWFGKHPTSNSDKSRAGIQLRCRASRHPTSNLENVRLVKIEILGESERKIIYDDFGA